MRREASAARRRRTLGGCTAALLLGAGCAEEPAPLLIVTFDTLRADHTSAYGYSRDTTPTLRRIAQEGVRFERAYAPMSVTAPSHATLFTGLYPATHRLLKNGLVLAGEHATLAELLAARGYQTAAVVSAFVLHQKFGLARGFDTYEDTFPPETATVHENEWLGHTAIGGFDRRGDATSELAVRWLREQRDPGRPFFLFVHYFDPHSPYSPPGEFGLRFPQPPGDPGGNGNRIQRYDGEIAFADRALGELLAALDAEGLAQRTLLVVTADHGEGLMDHGYPSHGAFPYEEEVRVPLLLRWPGRLPAGRVVEEPVGLVDVAPTLLGLLGMERPGAFQGRGLAGALRGEEGLDPERPVFLQRRPYEDGLLGGAIAVAGEGFAVRAGRWKYIDLPAQGARELYDLETDPGERSNRYYEEPEIAARLRGLLSAWRDEHAVEGTMAPVSQGDAAALEALGYAE